MISGVQSWGQLGHLSCGCAPLEEVLGLDFHPEAPDDHDSVCSVNRQAAAAILQPIDDNVPAAALDYSGTAGEAAPMPFASAHPVQVRPAAAHEFLNRLAALPVRGKILN